MAYVNIVAGRYAVNAPADTSLFADIVANENYLNNNQNAPAVAGDAPNVVNGSFELDVATTVQPTGWLFTAGTGGSGLVVNTTFSDGAQSYEAIQGTTAGNTAGTLVGPYNQATSSNQFYVCSPKKSYQLKFMLQCNRTDIQNSVVINWYSNAQGFLSSTPLLTLANGASPVAWTAYNFNFTPPSSAYYFQIQFNLGSNSVTPPGATGNIFVDGISISPRTPFQTYSAYAATTSQTFTFTVPSGVYYVMAKLYASYSLSGGLFGAPGGYAEVLISCKPGDTMTIVVQAGSGTSSITYGALVISVTGGSGGTPGSGSATLTPSFGMTGGSMSKNPLIALLY